MGVRGARMVVRLVVMASAVIEAMVRWSIETRLTVAEMVLTTEAMRVNPQRQARNANACGV